MSTLQLPTPQITKSIYLDQALQQRRSIRSFKDKDLTINQISQLLWAAQGITNRRGLRTAPSAGALYPLIIYLVKKDGIWKYNPRPHNLTLIAENDARHKLAQAAFGQSQVAKAALDVVIVANYPKITWKYGDRGIRYTYMEAGHAGQNLLLEAVALDLAAVPIGAFHDEKVNELLQLSKAEDAIYIISIGYKR